MAISLRSKVIHVHTQEDLIKIISDDANVVEKTINDGLIDKLQLKPQSPPTGSTAKIPRGYLYYDTTLNLIRYWDGDEWLSIPSASVGVPPTLGDYLYLPGKVGGQILLNVDAASDMFTLKGTAHINDSQHQIIRFTTNARMIIDDTVSSLPTLIHLNSNRSGSYPVFKISYGLSAGVGAQVFTIGERGTILNGSLLAYGAETPIGLGYVDITQQSNDTAALRVIANASIAFDLIQYRFGGVTHSGVDTNLNLFTRILQLRGSTSGTIKISGGTTPTNHTVIWPGAQGAASTVLTNDGSGNLSWASAGVGVHDLLSATHSDTLASGVSRGSLIVGNSTPNWAELNIGSSGYYLRSDGTDAAWYDLFGNNQTINADWITTGQILWQYSGTGTPFRIEFDSSVITGNIAEWYDSSSLTLAAFIDAGGIFNVPGIVFVNGSNSLNINVPVLTANRTASFPDVGGNVIMSAGTQTVGGTKTFTGNNTHSGNVIFSNSIKLPAASAAISTLNYGTYTPTLTNVANLGASTAYQCQWSQVGTIVTVSGKVDVDPTAAGNTQLGISLPVASNIGAAEDCSGAAHASGIAGFGAAIRGDAANNRAEMVWIAVDITNQPVYFTFTYEVI